MMLRSLMEYVGKQESVPIFGNIHASHGTREVLHVMGMPEVILSVVR